MNNFLNLLASMSDRIVDTATVARECKTQGDLDLLYTRLDSLEHDIAKARNILDRIFDAT